jgi:S1/P1 Nuclease
MMASAYAYRQTHRETGPWHFVDIPLSAIGYDQSRDCPGGDCVVTQIRKFALILVDKSAAPADRLEALKFVVHFIGDIHQPLHCEDNGDRGGNDVRLTYLGRSTDLHAVWDGGIIEAQLHTRLGPNYAPDLVATHLEADQLERESEELAPGVAPSGLAEHLEMATVQWANESHALAVAAYRDLPQPLASGWDKTYQGKEWPVVERQLTTAGLRLAELLNEVLP